MVKLIITSKKLGSFEVLYDDIDHELISKKHWYPYRNNPSNKNVYAKSGFYRNGKKKWISMHRLILLDTPRILHIDHKSGDCLDNRRGNFKSLYAIPKLCK